MVWILSKKVCPSNHNCYGKYLLSPLFHDLTSLVNLGAWLRSTKEEVQIFALCVQCCNSRQSFANCQNTNSPLDYRVQSCKLMNFRLQELSKVWFLKSSKVTTFFVRNKQKSYLSGNYLKIVNDYRNTWKWREHCCNDD